MAQDVLNAAEESVYDTLWNTKNAARGAGDAYRIAQAGYDYLMKRTRLSKKTIQRIIDRLQEKDFISIETPADIYHRTSTTYRVFSYRSVLERQGARGRLYSVKIGPGFVFAQQVSGPALDVPTVVGSNVSTEVVSTTPTVVNDNLTTVVPETTSFKEQCSEETSSSSEVADLKRLLEPHTGILDDDAVRRLLEECRARAGDATLEEIAYIATQKIRLVRSIQNPAGFMLTAIPRHFASGGHLSVRELLRKEAAQRVEQWREAFAFWTRLAEDPAATPADRTEARSVLRTLESSPDRPRDGT
jgi:predicted transcriptional regulator